MGSHVIVTQGERGHGQETARTEQLVHKLLSSSLG